MEREQEEARQLRPPVHGDGGGEERVEERAPSAARPLSRMSGGETGSRETAAPAAATDEEVDEFFAIIRRVHRERKRTSLAEWRPAFRREDFQGEKGSERPTAVGSPAGVHAQQGGKKRRWLDLNSEPEPESDPIGAF